MLSNLLIASLLALSTTALYTPRSRHLHARHAAALNQRVAMPEPLPAPVAVPLAEVSAQRVKVKRSSKKCKPRPTSALPSSAAASTSAAAAPVNVGADPNSEVHTTSSTSKSAQSHPSPAPAPSSSPDSDTEPPKSTPKTTAAPKPSPTTTASQPKTTANSGSGSSGSSSGGGGGNDPFSGFFPDGISGGDGTFYTPGLGACGFTNSESQDVAAIPFGLWDKIPGFSGGNPNNNPVCGKFIDVTYNGKTVTVEVVDECMGCDNEGSVDMSPHAFNQLADPSVGRIHSISWKWH